MTIRGLRNLFNAFWLTCLTGTIASLLWAVALPLPAESAISPATRESISGLRNQALPSLAAFGSLATLDLRQGYADAAKPVVNFNAKLRGTILEPDRPKAVFQTGDGRTELKGLGADIAGAKILAIEKETVTVSYNGETLILSIPKPK
jgi:hypothetical protein